MRYKPKHKPTYKYEKDFVIFPTTCVMCKYKFFLESCISFQILGNLRFGRCIENFYICNYCCSKAKIPLNDFVQKIINELKQFHKRCKPPPRPNKD